MDHDRQMADCEKEDVHTLSEWIKALKSLLQLLDSFETLVFQTINRHCWRVENVTL